ncbi:hypothetical protein IWZ00DRAFT_312765 [Phyllosticta capitalensis]
MPWCQRPTKKRASQDFFSRLVSLRASAAAGLRALLSMWGLRHCIANWSFRGLLEGGRRNTAAHSSQQPHAQPRAHLCRAGRRTTRTFRERRFGTLPFGPPPSLVLSHLAHAHRLCFAWAAGGALLGWRAVQECHVPPGRSTSLTTAAATRHCFDN